MEKKGIMSAESHFTELYDFKTLIISSDYDEKKLIKKYIKKSKELIQVPLHLVYRNSKYGLSTAGWKKINNVYYYKGDEDYNNNNKEIRKSVEDRIARLILEAKQINPLNYFYEYFDGYHFPDREKDSEFDEVIIYEVEEFKSSLISAINKMEEPKKLRLRKIEDNKREKEKEKTERKRQLEIIKKKQEEYNFYLDVKSGIDLKYSEGLEFIKNKKIPNAIFSFSEAIKLDNYNKSDYDLYFNRGIAKQSVGDMIGCISDMDKSINLKGNSAIKLFNKGLSQFNLKKFNEALNSFNELLELDASYKEALFYRGLSKINLEQKEEGCLDLSKAGELGYINAYDAIKKYCTH